MSESIRSQSVVAIYESHTDAEDCIKALEHAGLDIQRLSIVGKDFHTEEHALGFFTSGDRIKFLGGRGVLWGSLWGMLFSGAFFVIPVLEPLLSTGPFVASMVRALVGAAVGGGAGVIAAALTSIGMSNDSVLKYDVDVKAGKFLVRARGGPEMVDHARAILQCTGESDLNAHRAPSAVA
jgi:uncharacterized membrane protein